MKETMWSVELADDYNDDTFNGTYEECVKYCEDMEYSIGKDCRLAKTLVEDGCVIETLEIVDEIDEEGASPLLLYAGGGNEKERNRRID